MTPPAADYRMENSLSKYCDSREQLDLIIKQENKALNSVTFSDWS